MPDLKQTAANLKAGAEKARNTKSTRIWFMVGLGVILFILWWMNIIKTGFAIGLGIVILAAIGIETMNYDLDLGALWSGKSIQESRVTHTKDGLKLMGSCIIPVKGDKSDLNCDNFKTQPEAQAKYDQCANEIASYNEGTDAAKVKSLDIYGLDGNNNGIVCEALSGTPKVTEEIQEILPGETTDSQKTTPSKPSTNKKVESNTKPSTNTYSRTPILNAEKPYPITEATVRTNPKVLPVP